MGNRGEVALSMKNDNLNQKSFINVKLINYFHLKYEKNHVTI